MAAINVIKHAWNNEGTYSSGPVDVSLYYELIIDYTITAFTIAENQYIQLVLSHLDAFNNLCSPYAFFTLQSSYPPELPFLSTTLVENGFGWRIQIDLFSTDVNSRITGTLSVIAKGSGV